MTCHQEMLCEVQAGAPAAANVTKRETTRHSVLPARRTQHQFGSPLGPNPTKKKKPKNLSLIKLLHLPTNL